MSIDGLMPPNLVNMTVIRDFSAYRVFAQHNGFAGVQKEHRAVVQGVTGKVSPMQSRRARLYESESRSACRVIFNPELRFQ
jgi:hypothetical protein